jgi:hypothetical protein
MLENDESRRTTSQRAIRLSSLGVRTTLATLLQEAFLCFSISETSLRVLMSIYGDQVLMWCGIN